MAVSENPNIDFFSLKAKLFKTLYYAFIESGLCSLGLQCSNLPFIIPNVKHLKHTLSRSKNAKITHNIYCQDILPYFHNNDR